MEALVINTRREGYAFDQVHRTMTVGQLIKFLKDYDGKTPIYLGFDNQYTYGGIRESFFEEMSDEEE